MSNMREAAEAKFIEAKANVLNAVARGLELANQAYKENLAGVGQYRVAVCSLEQIFDKMSELESDIDND